MYTRPQAQACGFFVCSETRNCLTDRHQRRSAKLQK
nr:MAG TPA: hypothetical protein [Caudoviricetes sp.]